MIRSELTFALFLFLVAFSLGEDSKCVWKAESGKKYDLNPLARTSDYTLKYYVDVFDYTAYINFCTPLVTTLCGAGQAGCQTWGDMLKFQVSMGEANTLHLVENTDGNGVIASYTGGMEGRQFDVNLICDPNGDVSFKDPTKKKRNNSPSSTRIPLTFFTSR